MTSAVGNPKPAAKRRVAIVGAGFSGAVLAAQLMQRRRSAPDVVLIERSGRFGPGLAYGARDPAHLLNVRSANLSAFPDKPDHFTRWLARKGRGAKPDGFETRARYGAYVRDVLRHARRGWFGPALTRLRGEVIACRPSGEGWTLTLARGADVQADAVVLALGHRAPAIPSVFDRAGVVAVDPWDEATLRKIPKGDVLVLGTGLTGVDTALTLANRRRGGTIYMLSRRGQLPRAHLRNAAAPEPRVLEPPLPLSEALHGFRRQVRAAFERGEPWQHAIDRLRARTPELWRRLSPEAQLRFLRHLRPWWDAHRHRMAPEIAARLAELQQEGRVRVLVGEIVAVEQQGRAIGVLHRQRGAQARRRLQVAGVVNCTGAVLDPRLSEEPLVRQLLNDGLARARANGVGLDVNDDGRVIDGSGGAHPGLFALGPLTQGVFWESTAIPEIRVRAAAMAETLAS